MDMTIEQRMQIQEDIKEITELKSRYCRAADCGWDRSAPDGAAMIGLFAENGVWDAGSFGVAMGHKEILEFFSVTRNIFGIHYVMNPEIKVNGDTATGHWSFFCPGSAGTTFLWIGGTYDDEFVRTPQGWKFKTLKVTIAFTSPPEKGFNVLKTFEG
jgi:hypothetical protein